MPLPQPSNRSSPYAALAAQKADAAPAQQVATGTIAIPAPDPFLLEESRKLQQLKDALWDAFLSSRTTAIPSPLIDLTIAYTGLLKLQLSLLSASDPRQK